MNNRIIQQKLKEVPFLNTLSESELERIVHIAHPCFFKQKTYVFRKGQPLNKIFFVISGTVKIFHEEEGGKEQIVSLLGAEEMFPQICFLKKDRYPAHAQVTEDAQLLFFTRSEFEKVLFSNQKLLVTALQMLGETIVELQSRIEEKFFHNMQEQIILLFIRLCKTNGVQENGMYRLTTLFSNKDLANMIGTTSESIGKALLDFQEDKTVTVNRNGYYHIDMEKLKQKLSV